MEAERVGRQSNSRFGEAVMRQLEIAYLLACPRYNHYTEGPKVRLRSHPLIVAPRGTGKTYLLNTFMERCVGATDVFDKADHRDPRRFEWGRGTHPSKLRGSCTTDGRFIRPLTLYADFIIAGELDEALGSGPAREDRMGFLMMMTEDGKVSVSLVKMDELDDAAAKALEEEAASDPNLWFSNKPRGMTLTIPSTFMSATTPTTWAKIFKKRDDGGESRFDVFVWEPTNDEYTNYLLRGFPSDVDYSHLLASNRKAWNTKFQNVPYPPAHLVTEAHRWLIEQYTELGRRTKVPLREFASMRDVATVARTMTASAIARILRSRHPLDTTPVETIEYEQADVNFVKRYMGPRLGHLSMQMEAEANELSVSRAVQLRMEDCIHAYANKYDLEWPSDIPVEFVRNHFVREGGVAEGTARNNISELRRGGVVSCSNYRAEILVIDSAVLESLGFRDPSEAFVFDN